MCHGMVRSKGKLPFIYVAFVWKHQSSVNQFFNNFTYIEKWWNWVVIVANGAVMFLINIGITFAIFKLIGKVPEENDKLVINDTGLLKAVWNNFRNLHGTIEGPVDLVSFFITDNFYYLLLPLLVGDVKNLGSLDIQNIYILVLLNLYTSIFLVIVVKCLLNSLAISCRNF